MDKKLEKLNELFYNPKEGFISMNKLFEKVKNKKLDIPYKDVQEFYLKQTINQVMKPIRKSKKFNSIYANYAQEIYQMDIIIYDRYTIHNYKYIIVMIDIYSRKATARAMTNRKMQTIIEKFKDMIKEMGKPERIQCDNEFNKKEFTDLLTKDNIIPTFSDPEEMNKNAIVERFNGTLALLLQKVRLGLKRNDWYNYLEDVLYNYNTTVHSTTKETPNNIFDGKKSNRQKINIVHNEFNINDKVRIMRKKKTFAKGDVLKYSPEIYIIESITNKGNVHLIGIKRLYKPYEIKKIADIEMKQDAIIEPILEDKRLKKQMKDLEMDVVKPSTPLEAKRTKKPNKKYLV